MHGKEYQEDKNDEHTQHKVRMNTNNKTIGPCRVYVDYLSNT